MKTLNCKGFKVSFVIAPEGGSRRQDGFDWQLLLSSFPNAFVGNPDSLAFLDSGSRARSAGMTTYFRHSRTLLSGIQDSRLSVKS
jgi:hypothetical protein